MCRSNYGRVDSAVKKFFEIRDLRRKADELDKQLTEQVQRLTDAEYRDYYTRTDVEYSTMYWWQS